MNLMMFDLTNKQLEQFKKYYEFLKLENQKYNLTSITEESEVYIKHFYDSISVNKIVNFKNVSTLCDIGSGAGFPGIPLKIVYPHLILTIVEPTQKRCKFLEELVNLLELENVLIINERSEKLDIKYRDYFDIVTARAVASLPILLELTVPYVKVGGSFVALKGSSYEEELDLAKSAITKLDIKISNIVNYELPNDLGMRSLMNFKKLKQTKEIYPRNYALIKKKHL